MTVYVNLTNYVSIKLIYISAERKKQATKYFARHLCNYGKKMRFFEDNSSNMLSQSIKNVLYT